MKRFSIIIPVALATIVAGCSKDVETEKKPSGDPWIYDESLPVPIQFGASGLDEIGVEEQIKVGGLAFSLHLGIVKHPAHVTEGDIRPACDLLEKLCR